jgi:hypothetical protein
MYVRCIYVCAHLHRLLAQPVHVLYVCMYVRCIYACAHLRRLLAQPVHACMYVCQMYLCMCSSSSPVSIACVCMYVCMYVYIHYTYIHTCGIRRETPGRWCVYVCLSYECMYSTGTNFVHTYMHIHTYIHTWYVHVCLNNYILMYVFTGMNLHIQTRLTRHVGVYVYVNAYIHTYIHTYIYIDIHICTSSLQVFFVCSDMYVCMYVCMYIYINVDVYKHTHRLV